MNPMTEWLWHNGEIIPMDQARISPEDRGFQFADGVYEVIRFYRGKPFTLAQHLARLEKSAGAIQIKLPLALAALAGEIGKLIALSKLQDGMVYLQLTRGAAPRNHIYAADLKPTLLFHTRPLPPMPIPGEGEGARLLTVADERWKNCWIKSIALLPNILAKNAAVAAGFDEAAFIDNGMVTEGSSTNIFAVIGGKLVTHPVGSKVLPGITRLVLLEIAPALGIAVDEREFNEEEAQRADEMFITSTTRELTWVARWNDRYIGQGRCGNVTRRLHQAYQDRVRKEIAA